MAPIAMEKGRPRDPFGTAMVTNVGIFGIDTAFAPFTPIARCALVLAVMEVKNSFRRQVRRLFFLQR